jgi:hypothetical protein
MKLPELLRNSYGSGDRATNGKRTGTGEIGSDPASGGETEPNAGAKNLPAASGSRLTAPRAASRSAVSAPHLITLAESARAANFFGEPVVEETRLRVSRERLSGDLPPVLNLQETAWALCINRWTVRNLLVRRKLRGRQAISGRFIV